MNTSAADQRATVLVLVLGVSGAGKNVALGALEDSGFAVVNNLPSSLLLATVRSLMTSYSQPLAIAVNAQQPSFIDDFASAQSALNVEFHALTVRVLRLDADDATLTRRFAETRRKHPFASDQRTLREAIAEERSRIREVSDAAFELDTTATSAHLLRLRVKEFALSLAQSDGSPLLVISSFAYRSGIPPDADLVFDARILPNPYYEAGLATLTGRDVPVIDFLEARAETAALVQSILSFLRETLPRFAHDNRARVHIAIGCTGGQHRSVYVAGALYAALKADWRVLRHDREHPVAAL
ncbi:MAG: RNase adapter RapZ [Betaproteobacteria bacterium]|nr:MAG: RNase adapter RapZ [Betaproteobacteria bacterium]